MSAKFAREAIREYELEDRVEVLTGDYTNDSIGEATTLILTIGTLNFAKHALDATMKKIYGALNPKGVLVSISEGLTHEKTRPKEMAVSWLPSLLSGYDFCLAQGGNQ
jgi:cyclopropane fatty-acyl-phospholipid synthase-like methyltransferase